MELKYFMGGGGGNGVKIFQGEMELKYFRVGGGEWS